MPLLPSFQNLLKSLFERNTATHGGLKNQNLDFFLTCCLSLEWVQKAPFGAYLQFLVLQLLEIAPT
jgi:hypothetical protein